MTAKAAARPQATAWRNRITGSGEEAPEQLLANPGNWRLHPRNQQAALAGALDTVGWVQQVMVNRRTGFVVDGHARVALAISRNEPSVPVLYVDLSPAEEALVLATLDPIGAMATTDEAKLNELLAEVAVDDAGLLRLLGDLGARKPGLTTSRSQPRSRTSSQATCGSSATTACCAAMRPAPTTWPACSAARSLGSWSRIRPTA